LVSQVAKFAFNISLSTMRKPVAVAGYLLRGGGLTLNIQLFQGAKKLKISILVV